MNKIFKYQIFFIMSLSLWMETCAQETEDMVYEDNSNNNYDLDGSTQQHPRRLILGTPCLPCYKKDSLKGCRRIFDCTTIVDDTTNPLSEYNITDSPDYNNNNNSNNSNNNNNNSSSSINSNKNAELTSSMQLEPLHESLCLPCFVADHTLRCRRIRGCVVPTTTTNSTPLEINTETISTLDAKLSGNQTSSPNTTGTSILESASNTDFTTVMPQGGETTIGYQGVQPSGTSMTREESSPSATTTNITQSPQTANVTSASSASSVFVSDLPLLKTVSPSFFSKQTIPTTTTTKTSTTSTTTIGIPDETPRDTSVTQELSPSGSTGGISIIADTSGNHSRETTITATTEEISTTKQAPGITEGPLMKTPTSSFSSSSSSQTTTTTTTTTTTASETDEPVVVTTQTTTTKTEDPCLPKNSTGTFGLNIWCYFKNFWKWSR